MGWWRRRRLSLASTPWSRQRDLRERAVPSGGQWKALPSCRGWRQVCYWMPCGWVAALGGKYVGKHRPLAAPLLTGQRPHPQHDTGFSQPSLPASLPPRCLMFCLLVPAKHSLGISTSGPLLKRFALPGVSFLQKRLSEQASCRAPPPETFSPSPTALSLPRRLDLIFLVTRSLCGWEGSASSLGSPHQLSFVSQARRDLRAVLYTLDVF